LKDQHQKFEKEQTARKKIKDPGISFPLIIGGLLVVIIFFSLFMEALKFTSVYERTDEAIERSVIAVATQNWEYVYQSVREGYAGGNVKELATDRWEEVLDRDEIVREATEMLELDYEGGEYVKKDEDGEMIFSIKPQTLLANITNVGIKDSEGNSNIATGDGLIVEVKYDVTVAWTLEGAFYEGTVPITMERQVRVQYKPLF